MYLLDRQPRAQTMWSFIYCNLRLSFLFFKRLTFFFRPRYRCATIKCTITSYGVKKKKLSFVRDYTYGRLRNFFEMEVFFFYYYCLLHTLEYTHECVYNNMVNDGHYDVFAIRHYDITTIIHTNNRKNVYRKN